MNMSTVLMEFTWKTVVELWDVEGNVKTVAEKLAIYIHTHIISRQNTLEAIFHLIKFVEP